MEQNVEDLCFQIVGFAVLIFISVSNIYAESFSFVSMADSRGGNNGVKRRDTFQYLSAVTHQARNSSCFPATS